MECIPVVASGSHPSIRWIESIGIRIEISSHCMTTGGWWGRVETPTCDCAFHAMVEVEEEEGGSERKRARIKEWETTWEDAMPCAEMYEKSYMHKDVVTHVAVAEATHFFVTASVDGHLKLWKKVTGDVEFVKQFRAHLKPITDICISPDGALCGTVADDKTLKVFDIVGYDLMVFLPLPFTPQCAEWIFKTTHSQAKIAIADKDSGDVAVFDAKGNGEALHVCKHHKKRVNCMKYVEKLDLVVSGDDSGMIEYWCGLTYKFPNDRVSFQLKLETDLFELAKRKIPVQTLAVSPNGASFAVISIDRRIRVFRLRTGKLRRTYDESLEMASRVQTSDNLAQKLEDIDFGRRLMIEKQMDKDKIAHTSVLFDESGEFLVYTTHLGIKIVHVMSNKVVRILGKIENTERFHRLALYQGAPRAPTGARVFAQDVESYQRDPVFLCCAYKKQRMYMFTRREPDDTGDESLGRDVFNEKPSAEEMIAVTPSSERGDRAKEVILHTTAGDITVTLHRNECPKTVENFTVHCRNGYYDNIIFHRVIKGFMMQTGDPLGDGTGGTSVWGTEFEDEFDSSLRHNRPYVVSMANSGPNTNGSQFFITTVSTPWLDKKHTVFGFVSKGTQVVDQIEGVETDQQDKPTTDIKILNTTVVM